MKPLPSLTCCTPTAAAAGSMTLVHGPLCLRAEHLLSSEEYALWKSQLDHPARYEPNLSLVPSERKEASAATLANPVKKRPPRRRPERWNVGFRDPDVEDFA